MSANDSAYVFDAFVNRILGDQDFAKAVIQPENPGKRKRALKDFLDEMEVQTTQEFTPSERAAALEYLIQVTYGLDLKKMGKLQEALTGGYSAEFAL